MPLNPLINAEDIKDSFNQRIQNHYIPKNYLWIRMVFYKGLFKLMDVLIYPENIESNTHDMSGGIHTAPT